MTTQKREPNSFELRSGNTEIHYATTGIDGRASLQYKKGDATRSFRGDEIRAEDSALGRLVTVTLEVIPDLSTTTLSVLIPQIHLDDAPKMPFATLGVLTTARTSIGGPRLVKGALQAYSALELKGLAQAVDF